MYSSSQTSSVNSKYIAGIKQDRQTMNKSPSGHDEVSKGTNEIEYLYFQPKVEVKKITKENIIAALKLKYYHEIIKALDMKETEIIPSDKLKILYEIEQSNKGYSQTIKKFIRINKIKSECFTSQKRLVEYLIDENMFDYLKEIFESPQKNLIIKYINNENLLLKTIHEGKDKEEAALIMIEQEVDITKKDQFGLNAYEAASFHHLFKVTEAIQNHPHFNQLQPLINPFLAEESLLHTNDNSYLLSFVPNDFDDFFEI